MPIDARHPKEIRADIRAGRLLTVTAGLAPGFVQSNLAALPREQAYDFLLFCQRNPRPCPLIEVTDVRSPAPVGVAPDADLRTDLPKYRIYKDGALADEVRNRGVEPMPDMASVLRQADVVTCHTPHTKESHHMIDAAAVAQMKDGVIFVNTSRGKTQDEDALVAGLESGKIRAAGIDVFEEEPASSDNRLFQLEQVIVSPHVAGVTRETMRGMALQVTAEMLRVLRGEKPHVLANPDLWPRLGHLK